jgi:hypothetical protein
MRTCPAGGEMQANRCSDCGASIVSRLGSVDQERPYVQPRRFIVPIVCEDGAMASAGG